MTIDEDVLDSTVINILQKISVSTLYTKKLTTIHKNLQSIQLVDIPDPVSEDMSRIKRIIPCDKELNVKITDTRRNEIYTKCMSDIDEL